MNVLVVSAYPSVDDPVAARFVADQVSALARVGVRPWVVTFDRLHLAGDAPLRDQQESAIHSQRAAALASSWDTFAPSPFRLVDGIPVARISTANGPDRSGDGASGARRRAEGLLDFAAYLERTTWALVHAHMGYPDGAAAAELSAALDVPLVVTEHASFVDTYLADPAKGTVYRRALDAAARVIPVSEMLRVEMASALPDVAQRLRVIPNAVAVGEFRLVPPGDRDGSELLYVGYRKATKGIATLLDAMAIVHGTRAEVRLRMIGDAPTAVEESGWQARVAELGLEGVVSLEASADRRGVAAAMERAALLVQPSPRETFGIVAAEALASGLPVVAVDSGGVTEIMAPEPSRLGALVPNDAKALANAILATLDRRSSIDPAGLRAHIQGRYASDTVAARLAAIYDEVLKEATGEPGDRATVRTSRSSRPVAQPGASVARTVTPRQELSSVAAAPATARVIVVASQRPYLDRMLAAIPATNLAGIPIVTVGVPGPGLVISAIDPRRVGTMARGGSASSGAATRWTPRQFAGRVLRPLIGGRRRRRREAEVLAALRATVAQTASSWTAVDPAHQAPLAVCVGGLDALVIEPLVASGTVRPAPGGMRWLADVLGENA